ncbi:MAG: hypothetical protein S4CHLAM2_17170 [Chlamydiales bacterium]|nr:hypothetical protein [Chlamydiales bacterium]
MSVDPIHLPLGAYDPSYYSYLVQTNGGCSNRNIYGTALAIIFVFGALMFIYNSIPMEGRKVTVRADEDENND